MQMNNAIRLFFKQSGQLSMEVVILPELGKTCAQRGEEKKKEWWNNSPAGWEAKNVLL